ADSELVGCPEPALVVLVMMCRRIAFALASSAGRSMELATTYSTQVQRCNSVENMSSGSDGEARRQADAFAVLRPQVGEQAYGFVAHLLIGILAGGTRQQIAGFGNKRWAAARLFSTVRRTAAESSLSKAVL